MQGVLSVIFQNERYEPKMDCTVQETNSHVLKEGLQRIKLVLVIFTQTWLYSLSTFHVRFDPKRILCFLKMLVMLVLSYWTKMY